MRLGIGVAVVGVLMFSFWPDSNPSLSQIDRTQLLEIAREQLESIVSGQGDINVDLTVLDVSLARRAAAFVSVRIGSELRGCMIDEFEAHEPLVLNVLRNLNLAVLHDDRFSTPTADDLDDIRIVVSVVEDIKTLIFQDPDKLIGELTPFVDGVILEVDGELAAYLPDVWEIFPDPVDLLSQLCIKAGWSADRWRIDPYPTVQTYRVIEFGEPAELIPVDMRN
ncbi:AmmeMemoRadiSam system protein A [Candidatus Bipolaricaulota bacterium]